MVNNNMIVPKFPQLSSLTTVNDDMEVYLYTGQHLLTKWSMSHLHTFLGIKC